MDKMICKSCFVTMSKSEPRKDIHGRPTAIPRYAETIVDADGNLIEVKKVKCPFCRKSPLRLKKQLATT